MKRVPVVLFNCDRKRIIDLAARTGCPRSISGVGTWRRATGPADLPIEPPGTFAFVINMKTAKAPGFTILESVLLQADEVIQ